MEKFKCFVIATYVAVQIITLMVGYALWAVRFSFTEEVEHITGIAERELPLALFGLMIVVTVILLLFIKYGLSTFFYYFTDYILLFVVIFFISQIILEPYQYSYQWSTYLPVILSGIAVALRYSLKQFRLVAAILFVAGIAAILGSSLGIQYVIAFFLMLTAYDILAVRLIKHVPEIAGDVHEKGSCLMFTLETEEESSGVGITDILIPSVLVLSIFLYYFPAPPFSGMSPFHIVQTFRFSILGAVLCSLFALIGILMATRQRDVPALPYAALGILGFLIVEFIRFLVGYPIFVFS